MTVRVYRSSDASAPVLSGTAGALTAVLYACLVTGYGALAGAGWAREFTATNKAVFRAASGNRMRLRVDDTSTIEARAIGYEVMTDADTGTGPFPTNGQVSGGLYIRKSNTADTTARPWVIIADEKRFYFLNNSNGSDWLVAPTGSEMGGQFFFGEIASYKAGDAYNTLIIGAEASGVSTNRLGVVVTPAANWSGTTGHYMPRPYYQSAGSMQITKVQAMQMSAGSVIGNTGGPYPDPVTGALLLSPLYIVENGPSNISLLRGVMVGMWAPCHNLPAAHGDIVSGAGETAGKTFQLCNVSSSGTVGRAAFEISDTW